MICILEATIKAPWIARIVCINLCKPITWEDLFQLPYQIKALLSTTSGIDHEGDVDLGGPFLI